MTLDIRWRLARVRAMAGGGLRHLRREGLVPTWRRALAQLRADRTGDDHDVGVSPRVWPADPGKPRILLIDAVMPDPTRDSGSLRLCHLMRILTDMGWAVCFMPDNLRAEEKQRAALADLGVTTLYRPAIPSFPAWLRQEGATLGAVMLCRHYVARSHLGLVRRYAPSARVLFDTVDLHHVREMRAAEHAGHAKRVHQARRTRRQELDLIRRCDITFVVSPLEKQWLARSLPQADIRLLSNIHHTHAPGPEFGQRHDMLFLGGWGHPPNRDAIQWLVEEIFPQVRSRLPEVDLHLIGDLPSAARARLQQPGVRIHGRIRDLEPLLRQCRVALAPLRYGAGVKGKINTPMSYGLPVVATTMAVEGMHLASGRDVLVADTATGLAEAAVRVHEDDALWQRLARGGLENVRQHFSFDAARQCLASVLGTSRRP